MKYLCPTVLLRTNKTAKEVDGRYIDAFVAWYSRFYSKLSLVKINNYVDKKRIKITDNNDSMKIFNNKIMNKIKTSIVPASAKRILNQSVTE